MTKPIKKAYFIIPVLYLALSLMFLVLHFSDKGTIVKNNTIFNLNWEELAKDSGKSGNIESLDLKFMELTISFNKTNPLTIINSEGEPSTRYPKSYSILPEKTVEIEFDEKIRLSFNIEEPNKVIISSLIPPENDYSLFGFSIDSKADIESYGTFPGLFCNAKNPQTFIRFSAGGSFSKKDKILNVPPGLNSVIIDRPDAPEDPAVHWLTASGSLKTKKEFNDEVTAFMEKTYKGLSRTRYNSSSGNWRPGNFDEASLIALISESLDRGKISADRSIIQNVISKNQKASSQITAFFYGNIITAYNEYEKRFREYSEEAIIKLKNKDSSPLSDLSLLDMMEDINAGPLNKEISNFLKENEHSYKPDIDALLNICEMHFNTQILTNIVGENTGPYLEYFETDILPNIYSKNGTLFYNADITARQIARLGRAFINIGTKNGDEVYKSIGRDLIITMIATAGEDGIFSKPQINIDDSSYIQEIPESLYEIISPGPYFPKNFIWQGLQAKSVCKEINFSKQGQDIVIDMGFIAGETQHLFIQGVKPFKEINLYGIKWNGYSGFQTYDVGGWYYNEKSKTLFIKIKHEKDSERAIIKY